jgi:hypothetical protein
VTQHRFVFLSGVIERFHVLTRNYQQVSRGLGVNVAENNTAVVLIDHVARGSSGNYFAE